MMVHSNEDVFAMKHAEHEKAVQRGAQLATIEANLLQLNEERDKHKDELSKIPAHAKTGAQIRRREFLEQEIGTVARSIGTLK